MAFYKITEPLNTTENETLYYGCTWEVREDGVYADIPDYSIESHIASGHVLGRVEKALEPKIDIKLKDVKPEDLSAEDVVSGNTKAAVEKKEARAEKAAEVIKPKAKSKVVKVKSKGK